MKAAIPYPLRVVVHAGSNAILTTSEVARLDERITSAIRNATVEDKPYALLRAERQSKPKGWKSPELHRWKPPLSPLSLTAFAAHRCPINGQMGRIVMISARQSYGWHSL